ncbi:MAG TPA: matrixin family metalloprotease [Kofleriaceae bacterium]|nr:matrixin family metalloprotease [Kofleriaceae bacterium]
MSRFRCAPYLALLLAAACGPSSSEEVGDNTPDVSFDDFVAQSYHEPASFGPSGVYIRNGDTPYRDKKALRELYDELYGADKLIVHSPGGVDAVWSDEQKLNLTYCVGDSFGEFKDQVIEAMTAASDNGWETAANVNFIHVAEEDASCDANNQNVLFDVNQVFNQPYLARSFFPDQDRATRNLFIDNSSFQQSDFPLANIVTHELGHTLGWRHEHTRPEAGTCFEDNDWRELTPYDSASTMHYPQCNGTGDLTLTDLDREGAASVYGPPGEQPDPDPNPNPDPDPNPNPDPDPNPNPDPGTGVPTNVTASGTVALDENAEFEPLDVVPGTEFIATMTGTGDPDLYVRFGSAPDLTQFDCRPFIEGPDEECVLTVPEGETQAFIMVNGFAEGDFDLSVDFFAPQ